MNHCPNRNQKIDDTKFNRIKDLLERDENLGPDEIAVISRFYWLGSKLREDEDKANELLSRGAAKKDGRCRFRKYQNGGQDMDALVEACYLRQGDAFNDATMKLD